MKARAEKKPPKKITETYLHNSGLHYLQRFTASTAHFRRVMMRKVDKSCRHHAEQDRAACVKLVDELIEKFVRAGLLDDAVYTRGMVTSLRRRGESSRAIAARLAVKGLRNDDVRMALTALDDETGSDDFHAAVRFARRRRLGPFRAKAREPEKDMAAFARGGYGYEIASRVLKLTLREAEDLI